VKQNSIDMYVGGENIFKRLVQMLPFLSCFCPLSSYMVLNQCCTCFLWHSGKCIQLVIG